MNRTSVGFYLLAFALAGMAGPARADYGDDRARTEQARANPPAGERPSVGRHIINNIVVTIAEGGNSARPRGGPVAQRGRAATNSGSGG